MFVRRGKLNNISLNPARNLRNRSNDSRAFHYQPQVVVLGSQALSREPFITSYCLTKIFTPLKTLCSMADAHSSLYNIFFAPLKAAQFSLCPMPHAHSSVDDNIYTSLAAAYFAHCSVPDAHSSLLIFFVHPLLLHKFLFAPCLTHTPPF